MARHSASRLCTVRGEQCKCKASAANVRTFLNTGGFLFALVCLLLLYGIFGEPNRKIQLLSGLLFLVNLAGLAFTRTLTAAVGLAACLGLWLVFHHWWVLRTRRRVTGFLVLLWVALAAAVAVAGFLATHSGLKDRIGLVFSQMRSGDWTQVTSGRQPVYVITWQMIQERFWQGRGLNTFSRDFFFYRVGTPVGQSVELIDQPGTFREVHNEYLQVWEELGFWGLCFLAGILFWPLLRAVPLLFRTSDAARSYWIGMLCLGVVFFAINCLGHFPLHVSLSAACLVLLLAGLRQLESPAGHLDEAGSVRPEAGSQPGQKRRPQSCGLHDPEADSPSL